MKHFYKFLLGVIFLGGVAAIGTAQEIKTNDQGEKIVVFPDGTWMHLPDKNNQKPEEDPVITREQKARQEAVRLAEKAEIKARELRRDLEYAQTTRVIVLEDIEAWEESDLPAAKDKIKALKKELEAVQNDEADLSKALKAAEKWAETTALMVDMSMEKRNRFLNQMTHQQQLGEMPADAATIAVESVEKAIAAKRYKQYKRSEDVMYNPPPRPCEIAFEGKEQFSGIARKDVQTQRFFSYTPPPMRRYFKKKEFLVCDGSLSTTKGFFFLNLKFTLNAKNANRNYGILEKGSVLSIKTLNGETIRLINNQTDTGSHNPMNDSYIYRAQYILDNSILKQLEHAEIDRVRVFWSSGYEDYEVYELDFFIDQIHCLENG